MTGKSYDSIPTTKDDTIVRDRGILHASPNHLKTVAWHSHPISNSTECSTIDFDMSLGWKEAVLGIVLYLILGVIAYSFVFEKWDIEDSLYFSIITFTTIGTSIFLIQL